MAQNLKQFKTQNWKSNQIIFFQIVQCITKATLTLTHSHAAHRSAASLSVTCSTLFRCISRQSHAAHRSAAFLSVTCSTSFSCIPVNHMQHTVQLHPCQSHAAHRSAASLSVTCSTSFSCIIYFVHWTPRCDWSMDLTHKALGLYCMCTHVLEHGGGESRPH